MLHHDKSQISMRLPAELVKQFDRIAEVLERDRTWVMSRALKLYLAEEGMEILEQAEGITELDNGETVDFDSMLDRARLLVDAVEKKTSSRRG